MYVTGTRDLWRRCRDKFNAFIATVGEALKLYIVYSGACHYYVETYASLFVSCAATFAETNAAHTLLETDSEAEDIRNPFLGPLGINSLD